MALAKTAYRQQDLIIMRPAEWSEIENELGLPTIETFCRLWCIDSLLWITESDINTSFVRLPHVQHTYGNVKPDQQFIYITKRSNASHNGTIGLSPSSNGQKKHQSAQTVPTGIHYSAAISRLFPLRCWRPKPSTATTEIIATHCSDWGCVTLILYGAGMYRTVSQERPHTVTFEYFSQKSTDFNNFWYTKSPVNYAYKVSIKFSIHLSS